ncbi:hypothetical protein AB62_4703 [Escherichia coli 2-210-07_S1_C3]|nr:hypothetical protein AB62_4703 [Escherichia coli 2-210-07_S1_C3]
MPQDRGTRKLKHQSLFVFRLYRSSPSTKPVSSAGIAGALPDG